MRRVCLLFDLDLTLMVSDGAGSAAMRRAFQRETGVPDALDGLSFQGRTDRWIVGEVARRAGVDAAPLWRRYVDGYPTLLREELRARRPHPLPGVRELIGALTDRDDVAVGLATGNLREAAYIKLASAGLDAHFDRGGFGDDHEQRSGMLRDAIAAVGWRSGERLVVVGDTEHDISAARAVGAVAIGVATGSRGVAELAAAGADVALPDLGDLDRSLVALLGSQDAEQSVHGSTGSP